MKNNDTGLCGFEESRNYEALYRYLKTRLFRILVSSMKITQDALAGVYHFVPMQDFSHPWTDDDLLKLFPIASITD